LRDPAGVHHARPRVSLVPRVRGSRRFTSIPSLEIPREKTLLLTDNRGSQTTTAAKRLYTWDTPS
jgi:hypothetical protein